MARHSYARIIKILLATPLFILAAISFVVALIGLDHFRETTLPTPTGPFAVGRTMCLWYDPMHLDPLAPKRATDRKLVAWIWYPATASQSGQSYQEYLPFEWRSALRRQSGILLTEFLTRDVGVSLQQSKYPVVLMRGGSSALTTDYTRQLAVTSHYISTFFDVYLKGAPASELRARAGYPEVEYER